MLRLVDVISASFEDACSGNSLGFGVVWLALRLYSSMNGEMSPRLLMSNSGSTGFFSLFFFGLRSPAKFRFPRCGLDGELIPKLLGWGSIVERRVSLCDGKHITL